MCGCCSTLWRRAKVNKPTVPSSARPMKRLNKLERGGRAGVWTGGDGSIGRSGKRGMSASAAGETECGKAHEGEQANVLEYWRESDGMLAMWCSGERSASSGGE